MSSRPSVSRIPCAGSTYVLSLSRGIITTWLLTRVIFVERLYKLVIEAMLNVALNRLGCRKRSLINILNLDGIK